MAAPSHHRLSDTGRRRAGPQSVTPNSCKQTTAALPFYCRPDGQTETLSEKRGVERTVGGGDSKMGERETDSLSKTTPTV